MPKPPVESLLFQATRRMLGWLLILLFSLLIPTVGASLARDFLLPHPAVSVGPLEVPLMEWTTDGSRYSPPVFVLLGSLPEPGPNQKRAGSCNAKAAQVEINGGCWVETKTLPPCPEGYQWEHDAKCWLPVASAARLPSSGGSYPVNVADP